MPTHPRLDKTRIVVQNVLSPGRTHTVDAAKYGAMKTALLKVLPSKAPGLTQAEIKSALLPLLSEVHFPGGEKAGWWLKCVQLDLEAKGNMLRQNSAKPLRWHLAK